MKSGRLLALFIVAATVVLIVISILHPNESAAALADAGPPVCCVLLQRRRQPSRTWRGRFGQRRGKAPIPDLRTKASSPKQEFVRDLTGTYLSLRSYATLDHFEVRAAARSPRTMRRCS